MVVRYTQGWNNGIPFSHFTISTVSGASVVRYPNTRTGKADDTVPICRGRVSKQRVNLSARRQVLEVVYLDSLKVSHSRDAVESSGTC